MSHQPFEPFRSPFGRGHQRLVVAVLAFGGMGAAFMQTILMPIQRELPALLEADPSATPWVITVTLLASAVSVPISGRLGDMFGKRAVVVVLLAALLCGSIVCALSSSLVPMIVGRALQGCGMGIIPLGISLLRDVVDTRRLGTAIALVSATLGVGAAVGLPISALVVQHADWHMLFVIASVWALTALVLVLIVIPEAGERVGGRVDLVGAAGLAAGLAGILLAVSQGGVWGWASAVTLACGTGGVAILAAWGWYELRVADPMVDLRVSVRPAVLATNLASVAMGFSLFASSVAFIQFLELPVARGGLGLGLLPASLLLMPAGIAMLVVSPIAGLVERTAGPRPLLIGGALVIAVAYAVCLLSDPGAWTVSGANLLIGVGIGLGFGAMPALIMSAVPRSETGAANGLNTLMRSLGTTSAATVVGAILATPPASGALDGAFTLVFGLGLVAALVCAGIASLIPQPPHPGTGRVGIREGAR